LWSFIPLNYLYYHYIQTKNTTFQELYQRAVQEGVNETVLQQAMEYYNQAMEEYKKAEDIANGFLLGNLGDFRLFIHLRKSYADLKKAIRLLQEALKAQGS
jgi:tetratricopeptide (TPR) repeat protein